MSHSADRVCALAHMARPLVSEVDKVLELVVVRDALVLVHYNLVSGLSDSCTFYMAVDNLVLLVNVHNAAHTSLVLLGQHGVDIYVQDDTLQAHNVQELEHRV